MRVSASLFLVVVVTLCITCEQRNFDRCLLTGTDFQCEMGKFCKAIPDDPNGAGMCISAECTPGLKPSGCTPDKPVCSAQGRCVGCDPANLTQCATLNPALPYCVNQTCVACSAALGQGCESDPLHPACDSTTNTCRACALHGECASNVCVKDNTLSTLPNGKALSLGMCVPKSRILTVDETTCGAACTLPGQLLNASVDFPFLLVNNYSSASPGNVLVKPIAGLPELHIVTATADLSPSKLTAAKAIIKYFAGVGAVTVSPGASVTIEGLIIVSSNIGVLCDSGTAPNSVATSVKLLRSLIALTGTAVQTKAKCQLTLDQTWIGWGPKALSSVLSGGNAVNGGNNVAMNLDSTQFDIINSVFLHNGVTTFGGITVTDSLNLAPAGHIVNSTFYRQEGVSVTHNAMAIYCPVALTKTPLTIFNSLFVNSAGYSLAGKTYVDPNCRAATSFGYIATDESPAPGPGPGIVSGVSGSLFTSTVDDAFDLHPLTTAPMSVISGGTVLPFNNTASPLVDMDGTARGKTSVSIGAFEVAH